MRKIIFGILLLASTGVFGAAPTCQLSSSGEAYCSYTGKVRQIYINAGGAILFYFDTSYDKAIAEAIGFTPTNTSSAAFLVSDSPDFAKMFYSTALAAQASKRDVTIQMRGIVSGRLRFDRIWLAE